MNWQRIVCVLPLLAAVLTANGQAPLPLQIHYQGHLTSAGTPVNGPATITFRLYDAEGAATPVWSETHADVAVGGGNFSVMLGSQSALSLAVLDAARWLGVQAGGDAEMAPRQQLGAVPFAILAQQAGALAGTAVVQGSQISGTIGSATLSGETLSQLQGQFVSATAVQPPQTNVITPVDTASAGRFSSITIGADGLPIISYHNGAQTVLRAAKCGDPACSANNVLTTVDPEGGIVGLFTSIAIAPDGLPVIAYQHSSAADLRVAKCGNAACSADNVITPVDTEGNVGRYTSIAIGADGLPVISYYDLTNGDLKVAKCGDAACSAGNTLTPVDTTGNVGQYSSIAIAPDGLPVISYYSVVGGLKVAKCGDAACTVLATNPPTVVDGIGDAGQYSSIAIGIDGLPVIAYRDATNASLKVAKCANKSCSTGHTLTTVDATGFVSEHISLAIGADGLPIISYQNLSSELKVAKCGNAACSAGTTLTLLDTGNHLGTHSSITIGADGLPVIAYHDNTNAHLKVVKCANAFCAPYFRRR